MLLERPEEGVLELAKSKTQTHPMRRVLLSVQSEITENRKGLIPEKENAQQAK